MRWIKWTMLAATALVPVPAFAEQPPASQPAGNRFTLKTQDGHVVVVQEGGGVVGAGGNVVVLREGEENEKPRPGAPAEEQREQMQRQLQQTHRALTYALDHVRPQEKGSYLGVSASPPPQVLRKQLGLQPGMGLVVDLVVPDSPAAHAGVQRYDVVQKLDDQLIVNQEQLAVLVRSHKPGDEVKLAVIHEGKAATLTAKLTEHDLEPLAEENEGNQFMLRGQMLPEPRIQPWQPGQPNYWGQVNPWGGWAQPGAPLHAGPTSVTWLEDGSSYTLATNAEGKKTFTVKDKDGKVTFEGPVNTKEEREKLPPDMKQKLDHMQERMLGGQGGFGKANPQPAPNPRKPKPDKDSDEK